MNKRQFVQAYLAACRTPFEKVEAGINYAESVWAKMTSLGYGEAKQAKQRESRDYYAELTEYQRTWFDKFWIAFDNKQSKQRAAMSWLKLGELTEAQYQHIAIAAKAEAVRPRKPGEIRAMAELWLNERRFDDNKVTTKSTNNNVAKRQEIYGKLQSLKRLNEATPSEAFQEEIAQLQTQLDELNNQ